MTRKSREREGFSKDISGHIGSRYPSSREGAVQDMVTNKMMAYVNMFRAS